MRVCARHIKNDSPRCPVCRAYRSVREAEIDNLCIQCAVPMVQTSGQKRICKQCGALRTCCDTV